jgi:hypothetical protein
MQREIQSPILGPDGVRAPVSACWQAPAGSSPWFGWFGDDGFTTVRIESIKAVTPHPQMRGRMIIWCDGNCNLVIGSEDCMRLLKRMGWMEPNERRV